MRTLLGGPVMSSLEGDPVFGVVVRLVGQRGGVWAIRKPSNMLVFGGVRRRSEIEF
jgi:hypothetical protein